MKLKFSILDKLIASKCSKTDINLIFFLASKQIPTGHIYNVYYKEVVDTLEITPISFYRRIEQLQLKGIISYELAGKYGYYNFIINDNDCSDMNFEEGYLNINRDFFFSEGFRSMRASEKYVLLKIMKRNQDNFNEINMSDEKIAEYAQIDVKNKRLISRIMDSLKAITVGNKAIFDVFTVKRRKRNIHFFKLIHNVHRNVTEKEVMQRHQFKSFCRKHKIAYTEKDMMDLIQMDNQYSSYQLFYKNIVKEILLQYGEVKCAVIRKLTDKVVNRISLYATELSKEYISLV